MLLSFFNSSFILRVRRDGLFRDALTSKLVSDTRFDPEYYLHRYPDVKASGIDPLTHWFFYGQREGREGFPPDHALIPANAEPAAPSNLDQPVASEPERDPPPSAPVEAPVEAVEDAPPPPARTGLDDQFVLKQFHFDPEYYLMRYPDVKEAGLDPSTHWLQHGRAEGRICSPPVFHLVGSAADLDPAKKTVLIVSHEASRTGAPVLALNILERLKAEYNIVCLLLAGGNLTDNFVRSSQMTFQLPIFSPPDAAYVTAKVLQAVRPDFALVNCVVSFPVLPVLAKAGLPTVTLIHDFAVYVHPMSVMEDVVRWSTHLVFSANLTKADAQRCIPKWTPGARTHILPQGRCFTGANNESRDIEEIFNPSRKAEKTASSASAKKPRVVIGAGSVNLRKGCDVFVQCAQQIIRRDPDRDIRFIWIGHGYNPVKDITYSVYLSEQIRRSGLTDRISFVGELASLDRAYRAADMLLITSRLDPLPNVGIDAICLGLPVLCFESGSGIADVLQEEGLGELCAPYLDSSAMAEKAIRILDDEALESRLRQSLIEVGRRRFNMTKYVSSIDSLLNASVADAAKEEDDVRTILASGKFRHDYWWNEPATRPDPETAVRIFVREGRSGLKRRRPTPNFDPEIFAREAGVTDADAFAAYLRAGCPDGPWIDPPAKKLRSFAFGI